MRLRWRHYGFIGAYTRGCEMGLSTEDAIAYARQIQPPTEEDLAYEAELLIRAGVKNQFKSQPDGLNKSEPILTGVVTVHMLGLTGYVVEQWEIGRDVEQVDRDKFYNDADGASIYAMRLDRNGAIETFILSKSIWMAMKAQLDAVR